MSREIDERIATEVMGFTIERACGATYYNGPDGIKRSTICGDWSYWSPSEDPAAAMEVVERMKSLGFSLDADNFTGTKENPWSVRFGRVAGCWDYDGSEEADTFCKAVCLSALAALRAVGGEGGRKDG